MIRSMLSDAFLFLTELFFLSLSGIFFGYRTTAYEVLFFYGIIFFAFSLWIVIIVQQHIVYYGMLIIVAFFFIMDRRAFYFLPLFTAAYSETWVQHYKISLRQEVSKFFFFIPGILIVVSTVLGDSAFCVFLVTVSFYAVANRFYRLKADQLISLQDSLSEHRLVYERTKCRLQNDTLKNTEAAVLAERNRISSSLHNSIGHTISSAIVQLNALQYITADTRIHEKLNAMQHSLEHGMNEIRDCLHNLKRDSFRLETSLEELTRNTPTIQFSLTCSIDRIDYTLKHDILFIIKECIANTLKHSNADFMRICVIEQPLFYSVSVHDNGKSTAKVPSISTGIGLTVIRETAVKHGGTARFYVENGFKMHLVFPKEP